MDTSGVVDRDTGKSWGTKSQVQIFGMKSMVRVRDFGTKSQVQVFGAKSRIPSPKSKFLFFFKSSYPRPQKGGMGGFQVVREVRVIGVGGKTQVELSH